MNKHESGPWYSESRYHEYQHHIDLPFGSRYKNELHDRYRWCAENCRHYWCIMSHGRNADITSGAIRYSFEDPDEAMQFKLIWSV